MSKFSDSTIRKFLKKLPKTGWKMTSSGQIRRRTARMGLQCPLTAAARMRGTSPYGSKTNAVQKLGLPLHIATEIVDAADWSSENFFGDELSVNIRKRMLRRLGLKEVKL